VNQQFLAHRWMVGIGLISYPLYLWHWPLISWLHITEGQTPPAAWLAAALGLSFVLAYATWRWIERPLRFGRLAKRLALMLLLCVASLGVTGWVLYQQAGWPERSAAKVTLVYPGDHGHQAFFSWMDTNSVPCTPPQLYSAANVWEGHVRCRQSRLGPVDVALVGDSHAEHLFPGLVQQYPELNIAYYFKIGPAFLGNPKFDAIFEHVTQTSSIQHVVLTMFWERRLKVVPAHTTMTELLLNTAAHLQAQGKTVSITTGVPHFGFDPNLCRLQRIKLVGQDNRCQTNTPPSQAVTEAFAAAKVAGVQVLDSRSFFCSSPGDCSMVKEGRVLFRDDNHLNIAGAESLATILRNQHPNWIIGTP
jgi:hypothetical protein